jgi:hypothetical protein
VLYYAVNNPLDPRAPKRYKVEALNKWKELKTAQNTDTANGVRRAILRAAMKRNADALERKERTALLLDANASRSPTPSSIRARFEGDVVALWDKAVSDGRITSNKIQVDDGVHVPVKPLAQRGDEGFYAEGKGTIAYRASRDVDPDGVHSVHAKDVFASWVAQPGTRRLSFLETARALLRENDELERRQVAAMRAANDAHRAMIEAESTSAVAAAVNVNVQGLQEYFRRTFSRGGHAKPDWRVTGFVGQRTRDSVVAGLRASSSLTDPPDGCDMRPLLVGGRVAVLPLMPHQGVVHAMAHLRATDAIRTPGLLAFHGTGAGKTLELLAVLLQFWTKPWAIVIASVRSNQDDNDLVKLARLARRHFGYFDEAFRGSLADAYGALCERLIRGYGHAMSEQAFETWMRKANLPRSEATRRLNYRNYIAAYGTNSGEQAAGRARERRLLATYTTLGNDIEAGLFGPTQKVKNVLFLLDEVQFLVDGAPSKDLENQYASTARMLTSGRDPGSTWVFASTATPGSTFAAFCEVMNIVSASRKFSAQKPIESIREPIRGLVSYVDPLGNRAQFASVSIVTECVDIASDQRYMHAYMREALQYRYVPQRVRDALLNRLVRANEERWNPRGGGGQTARDFFVSKVDPKTGALVRSAAASRVHAQSDPNGGNPARNRFMDTGSMAYYSHMRRLALYIVSRTTAYVPPRRLSPLVGTKVRVALQGGGYVNRYSTYMIGPKLAAVLRNIHANPDGLHYVYVADPKSKLILAHLLERDLGMQPWSATAAAPAAPAAPAADANAAAKPKTSKRKPRSPPTFGFVNVSASTQKTEPFERYNQWSKDQVEGVKAAASSKDNATGGVVRVLLATKEAYKGVDVANIRYLHMLDPFPDFQHFLQFVGRGPRLCSHRHLPMHKRSVVVTVYRLHDENEDCDAFADCHVWTNSFQKYDAEWGRIKSVLAEEAVDAELFGPTYHAVLRKLRLDVAGPCATKTKTSMALLRQELMTKKELKQRRNNGNNDFAMDAAYDNDNDDDAAANNAAAPSFYRATIPNPQAQTRPATRTAEAYDALLVKSLDNPNVRKWLEYQKRFHTEGLSDQDVIAMNQLQTSLMNRNVDARELMIRLQRRPS